MNLGCHLSDDSTYQEWCEGGSCGDGAGNGGGFGGTGSDSGGPGGASTGFAPILASGCPEGYSIQGNHGFISFICPDQDTEDQCHQTFGSDFFPAPCLSLGCVVSDDSTYEEWCASDDPAQTYQILPGPNGCPADCHFSHNYGTVEFLCPDANAEIACHSTYGPDFSQYHCLSLGCVFADDAAYKEWCEGGSCGYPTDNPHSPTGCPDGTSPQNNGGSLWFDCPDPTVMDACRETFSSGDYSYMLNQCIALGCAQSADSTYHEWCEGPTTEPPTNDWQPMPMCPDWASYNLSGHIDWQCSSGQSDADCQSAITTALADNSPDTLQNAVHDCYQLGK